jgi:hypothetical protein
MTPIARHSLLTCAALLVLVPLLVASGDQRLAPAAATSGGCLRGGAELVLAAGHVRVVALPGGAAKRVQRLYACWTRTGRRFALSPAAGVGSNRVQSTVHIVGDHVGSIVWTETRSVAALWDARTGRKLHDSRRCPVSATARGVGEAVFLSGGAMAYSCRELRLADADGDRQLVPAGGAVNRLAVSVDTGGPGGPPVLYWQENRDGPEPHSLELAP